MGTLAAMGLFSVRCMGSCGLRDFVGFSSAGTDGVSGTACTEVGAVLGMLAATGLHLLGSRGLLVVFGSRVSMAGKWSEPMAGKWSEPWSSVGGVTVEKYPRRLGSSAGSNT